MAELKYVKGDATKPLGDGPRVICHCCNDQGGWGSGFVVALSKRWKAPEMAYRRWHLEKQTPPQIYLDDHTEGTPIPFQLGQVQLIEVEPELWVANIIGQHKTINSGERRPIRYAAIQQGLETVRYYCTTETVHMPRMGAGLARGNWGTIESIIMKELVEKGVDTTVYDL